MEKKIFAACLVFLTALLINSIPALAQEEAKSPPLNDQAPAVSFDEDLAHMARADSIAAIMKAVDEAAAKCAAYDDFERLVSGIKKIISEKAGFKFIDALYYAAAKVRLEELSFLSRNNDIESGRIYMSVNETYRNEATDYTGKVLANTKSKDLILDSLFLQFLAMKDTFQSSNIEAFLDDMADKISKYSNDSSVNKLQLNRAADQFANKGLGDYALKLKIAYARKAAPALAQDVFDDIKKDGDKNFAQGNLKQASTVYDAYISAARACFSKEAASAKIMEIAEKYFGANRYREARKYYELYAADYPDSKVIDYCKYKAALCFYYEKDKAKAVSSLEDFLAAYQNSVWFDRAFETLCRLFFREFPIETALPDLQKLVGAYYRKDTGDYAYALIGLLYYSNKEYGKALESLKKVDINSVYAYMAELVTKDIKDIKAGNSPSYNFGGKDKYRMWEPGKAVTVELIPMEAGDAAAWLKGQKGEDKKIDITYADNGAGQITVKPGEKIRFSLGTLADEDRFAEYLQDKDDISRLPKKVREENEKDLISIQWSSEGGKFLDERQTRDKIYQAPDQPGAYKISVIADDLGLVRLPDKGSRKDAAKEIGLIVNVK